MKADTLGPLLADALLTLEASRDELRDLDAAIGDGDLGLTISEGARAIREGIATLAEDATVGDILRSAARSFASANPSTMAALIAAGLMGAARAVGDTAELDRAGALLILETAMSTIAQRGGAELGDKTILDAIDPTLSVLRDSDADDATVLKEMIDAAQAAVTATALLQSRRGRAAWVGERTIGHPDGGATAYLRLLQAIERALAHYDHLGA
ncbi:MAG: phosphoenolpyruvate---glycerone phosphotransferase subunit DhaL [Pseudonocardiales bacterium]|nr:phosphoenolpyruvate---glycerone phosphotransferase subunit DhaL [Pseudonocardiales bacterium]